MDMKLLQPVQLGDIILRNAMVMAPMTRSRADIHGEVGELTVLYYMQRAEAGLIISEGINISESAIGSPFTPSLYTSEQIEAWKKVTDAVHVKGGKIIAQLWHTGRVGHSVDKNNNLPVAPSAIAIEGQTHFTSQGPKPYEVPRALSTEEVKHVIADYRKAAENAKAAGFDGVELHAAFGYLPNQFLVESSNQRTDEYGGSIENRVRFVFEVMQQLAEVWPGRAAIKLSPSIPYNNMLDSDPKATFSLLIEKLNELPLAYLQLMNPLFPIDNLPHYPKDVMETFGKLSRHLIVANGGYNRESAEAELNKGIAKMISFGVLFLANPDLPKRFSLGSPLNAPDRATFYSGGEKGYTDYPSFA
jgi:N-ethylmaleimide reductase